MQSRSDATAPQHRGPLPLLLLLLPLVSLMLLFLLSGATLFLTDLTLPAVVPASAPPTEFSEQRVMLFLKALTSGVRSHGSCNNELFAPLLLLRFLREDLLGFPPTQQHQQEQQQVDQHQQQIDQHQHHVQQQQTREREEQQQQQKREQQQQQRQEQQYHEKTFNDTKFSPDETAQTANPVQPVLLFSFNYYLLANYGSPNLTEKTPTFTEKDDYVPVSHKEGARPRFFPPGLLSTVSLCSVFISTDALFSSSSIHDSSRSKSNSSTMSSPSADIQALLSSMEVPPCDDVERVRILCEGEDSSGNGNTNGSSSIWKEARDAFAKKSSWTNPLAAAEAAAAEAGAAGGTSAQIAHAAVAAYEAAVALGITDNGSGSDAESENLFMKNDERRGQLHAPSVLEWASSSPLFQPKASTLWYKDVPQLKARCFRIQRHFLASPAAAGVLRGSSSSNRNDSSSTTNRRKQEAALGGDAQRQALESLLVVDVSSQAGLAGGHYFRSYYSFHILHSGLHNLVLRLQPFKPVLRQLLQMQQKRDDQQQHQQQGESTQQEPHQRLQLEREPVQYMIDSSQRALLLSAHTDSFSGSPGATDDGVMVGVILEVVRNLVYKHVRTVQQKLVTTLYPNRHVAAATAKEAAALTSENDSFSCNWQFEAPLIIDINGAEEVGLLGAMEFATLHPYARQTAFAINLDAAGRGGLPQLYQVTGVEGPRAFQRVSESVRGLQGTSFTNDVLDMNLGVGDDDLRVWRDVLHISGGLDFGFIFENFFYHTKYDNIYRLIAGSAQLLGEALLPAVQALLKELPLLPSSPPSLLVKQQQQQQEAELYLKQDQQERKTRKEQHFKNQQKQQQQASLLFWESSSRSGDGDATNNDNVRNFKNDGRLHWTALNTASAPSEGATPADANSPLYKNVLKAIKNVRVASFQKIGWPASVSYFCDFFGLFMIKFPLRLFEWLSLFLLLLLTLQMRLERSRLQLRFSPQLTLLSVAALLLAAAAAAVGVCILSLFLSILSPMVLLADNRLLSILYVMVAGYSMLKAWHYFLFRSVFKRFPAEEHPFKAEQAAFHGAEALWLVFLVIMRCIGVRTAALLLLVLLVATAARSVILYFFPIYNSNKSSSISSSVKKGFSISGHLVNEHHQVRPAMRYSVKKLGTEDAATAAAAAAAAAKKMLLMQLFICAALVVPLTMMLKVIANIINFGRFLQKTRFFFGSPEAIVFNVCVLPFEVLVISLLVAPPLFFSLHHWSCSSKNYRVIDSGNSSKRSHNNNSRQQPLQFLGGGKVLRIAAGALFLAFLLGALSCYYWQQKSQWPSDFSFLFQKKQEKVQLSQWQELQQHENEELQQQLLLQQPRQAQMEQPSQEWSLQGEKSWRKESFFLATDPVVWLQKTVDNLLQVSTRRSSFFPFSKDRPMRLYTLLFTRSCFLGNAHTGQSGVSIVMERVNCGHTSHNTQPQLMVEQRAEGKGNISSSSEADVTSALEDVGILLGGMSAPGKLLDPTNQSAPAVYAAIAAAAGAAAAVAAEEEILMSNATVASGGPVKFDAATEELQQWVPKLRVRSLADARTREEQRDAALNDPIQVFSKANPLILTFVDESSKMDKLPKRDMAKILRPPIASSSNSQRLPPVFLHPTRASFKSTYDPRRDETLLNVRVGGASVFLFFLPENVLTAWSLEKQFLLQRVVDCDCLCVANVSAHPPSFVDFSLRLKGKTNVRFSSISLLVDATQPIAQCRTASLFDVFAADAPFSATAPLPPVEHRAEAAAARAAARATAKAAAVEGRADAAALKMAATAAGAFEPYLVFWDTLEQLLPEHITATYITAELTRWDIPEPPFESSFSGLQA